MDAFEIKELIARCIDSGQRYREFVQVPSMSAGVFILPAGAIDDHSPHARDELYYVLKGQGVLRVRGEDREVGEGSAMFVRAGVEHHFHTISQELMMLVFFGGEIETSQGSATGG